jgi:hypothetical protein
MASQHQAQLLNMFQSQSHGVLIYTTEDLQSTPQTPHILIEMANQAFSRLAMFDCELYQKQQSDPHEIQSEENRSHFVLPKFTVIGPDLKPSD